VSLGYATPSRSSEDVERLRAQIEKLKLENERLKLELKNAQLKGEFGKRDKRMDDSSEPFLEAPTSGMTWDEFIERHRTLQGEKTPDSLQEKYLRLVDSHPNEPAYAYLAARAGLDYVKAEKCTQQFPQFVWCHRFLALDDGHYDRALKAAKKWARLVPASKEAAERVAELIQFQGCHIRLDLDPVPTGDTYSSRFWFHVTAANESKYLDLDYNIFEISIEWMGNTYTGMTNLLNPRAGSKIGNKVDVSVDADHPATKDARPTVKSMGFASNTKLRNRKSGWADEVRPEVCKVTMFLGDREWVEHQ
jgi:hypothetical protein